MSMTRVKPPSSFQIMEVMKIAEEHLQQLTVPAPGDDEPDDDLPGLLLERLKVAGADIGQIVEWLLLAASEAKIDAEAVKAYRDKLKLRQQRLERRNEAYRAAVLTIMGQFPELFPPSAKSKAVAAFRSPAVDARVQRAPEGIIITDADKLMQQERFVVRSLNTPAVKEAVLKDGEELEGVERKNGGAFLVIRTS